MNAINSIKTAFSVTGKNLILAQPLVLFLLVFSILSVGVHSVQKNLIASFIFAIALILLVVAFGAGWFYMTKKTIAFELYETMEEDEKALKSFGLIKHFFPGVGEYFLPMIGLFVVFFIISALTTFSLYKFGIKYIGTPDIDMVALNKASNSMATFQTYLNTLPPEKLRNMSYWIGFVSLAGMFFQFLTMWFVPSLFYRTKNPFKALYLALKFLFTHFFQSVAIMLFLVIFNVVVSVVNTLSAANVILALVGFLLFFYYATYYIVLIFLYYGQNGEQTAKDYINSGDNCDWEKLACGEDSKED